MRLKKISERLSEYHFEIGYRKGTEMVICDWLSRSYYDDDEIGDIPPIALKSHKKNARKHHYSGVVTRSKIDPAPSPQMPQSPKVTDQLVGQIPDTDQIPKTQGIVTRSKSKVLIPDLNEIDEQQDEDLTYQQDEPETYLEGTPAEDTDILDQRVKDLMEPIRVPPVHLDDPSPYQKHNTLIGHQLDKPITPLQEQATTGIPIITTNTPVDQDDIHVLPSELEMQELGPLFDNNSPLNIINKRIPRQCELDEFIELVKKRSLKDFSTPLRAQQISHQQKLDPYFKDIYEFLKHGVLPSNKRRANNTKNLAEDFILVDQVLFKIIDINTATKFKLVLAIPEKCVPYIFSMNHDSLWSGHLGHKKTFQMLRSKYFIP
jgi:hypothetical protein